MRKSSLIVAILMFLLPLCFLLIRGRAKAQSKAEAFGHRFQSYSRLYTMASDSLQKKFTVPYVRMNCVLDSLFYFNPEGTSFVGAMHCSFHERRFADQLSFVYGEKIAGRWYFFKGNTYLLPRALFGKDSLPLSYADMHRSALEDIFYPFALSKRFDFKSAPLLNGYIYQREREQMVKLRF